MNMVLIKDQSWKKKQMHKQKVDQYEEAQKNAKALNGYHLTCRMSKEDQSNN